MQVKEKGERERERDSLVIEYEGVLQNVCERGDILGLVHT